MEMPFSLVYLSIIRALKLEVNTMFRQSQLSLARGESCSAIAASTRCCAEPHEDD